MLTPVSEKLQISYTLGILSRRKTAFSVIYEVDLLFEDVSHIDLGLGYSKVTTEGVLAL